MRKQRHTGFPLLALLLLAGVACALWYAVSSDQRHRQGEESSDDTEVIAWLTDYDEALELAVLSGKLVVVDFMATWCGPCEKMNRTTFGDQKVRQRMADFVPLKIDIDREQEIAARYGIDSVPTTVIVEADGLPVTGTVGYLDSKKYLGLLDAAQSKRPKLGIVGRPAPSLGVDTWFNLPEGQQSVDVSDYKGKVLVLYGFQSGCPGCHKHGFPTLVTLLDRYEYTEDVAFIAVQTTFEGFSGNTPDSAKKTADSYNLTIPIGHSGLPDEPSTVMKRYRTGGTPWTIIIDRQGIVRFNDFQLRPHSGIALIDRLLTN